MFVEFLIRFSVSAEKPATIRGLFLLFFDKNSKISLLRIKFIDLKSNLSFFIFFLLFSFTLKSVTAAAHTAISTGNVFFTSLSISSADVIFFTIIPLGVENLEGPAIKVVFTPSLLRAIAIS